MDATRRIVERALVAMLATAVVASWAPLVAVGEASDDVYPMTVTVTAR